MEANGCKYVTTNEYDETVRGVSELVNPMRLEQATHHVGLSGEIVHVDTSKARHANYGHWFFGNQIGNKIINIFYIKILYGDLEEYYPCADQMNRNFIKHCLLSTLRLSNKLMQSSLATYLNRS